VKPRIYASMHAVAPWHSGSEQSNPPRYLRSPRCKMLDEAEVGRTIIVDADKMNVRNKGLITMQ
jgi:hypothetical protein